MINVIANKRESKILQYKADVYPEPVWISAGQFQDYITVDKVDRFNYLSVYFNVMDDNHPPLHFMLLHTMSSLFSGMISPLLGCFINMAAVAVCILCFFRLGNLLEVQGILPSGYGKAAGICMALLYGLSAGAIATVLLIRMYGVMTACCVLLFYLHLKKWLEKGFDRKNKGVCAVTVLGFLTQYFFLFYCLTLAGVTACLLAARKRYRELKIYIRTMLTAAVVGVGLFPFSIKDVFSSGRGEEALQNLGRGLSGYGIRLSAFGSILVKGCFGGLVLGILVLACIVIGVLLTWYRGKAGQVVSEKAGLPVWLMLLLPCCCYFLLAARMSPYLVDRYIMPLFPFIAIILTLVSVYIFSRFPRQNPYWMLLPAIVIGIVNVAGYDGEYLYQGYEKQLKVAEEYAGLPCICLYDGQGFYYNLMEFTEYGETLLLRLPELEQREDTESLTGLDQAVVLRKSNVEESEALEILRGYGLEVKEVLMEEGESVYGDTVYLVE